MRSYLVKKQIESLLAEGIFSRRQIARKLDVSRTLVNAVANGRRRRRARLVRPTACDSQPRMRCPSCGYRVPLPCVFCRAVAYRRTTVGLAFQPDAPHADDSIPRTADQAGKPDVHPPIEDSP